MNGGRCDASHEVCVCVCARACVYFPCLFCPPTVLQEHIYMCKSPIILLTITWIEITIYKVEVTLQVIVLSSHHMFTKYILNVPIL